MANCTGRRNKSMRRKNQSVRRKSTRKSVSRRNKSVSRRNKSVSRRNKSMKRKYLVGGEGGTPILMQGQLKKSAWYSESSVNGSDFWFVLTGNELTYYDMEVRTDHKSALLKGILTEAMREKKKGTFGKNYTARGMDDMGSGCGHQPSWYTTLYLQRDRVGGEVWKTILWAGDADARKSWITEINRVFVKSVPAGEGWKAGLGEFAKLPD